MTISEKILEDFILQTLSSTTSEEIKQQLKTNHELREKIRAIHMFLVNNYIDHKLDKDQLSAFQILLLHDKPTQDMLFNQQEIKNAMTYQQSKLSEKEASIKIDQALTKTIQDTDLDWNSLGTKSSLTPVILDKKENLSTTKWRKIKIWGLVAASLTAFFFLFNLPPTINTDPGIAYLKKIPLPMSLPELTFQKQEEQVSATPGNNDLEAEIKKRYEKGEFDNIIPLCDELIKTGTAKQKDYGVFVKSAVFCHRNQFEKAIQQLKTLHLRQDSEIFIAAKYFLALAYLKKKNPDFKKGTTLLREIIQILSQYKNIHPDQIYKTEAENILAHLKNN